MQCVHKSRVDAAGDAAPLPGHCPEMPPAATEMASRVELRMVRANS